MEPNWTENLNIAITVCNTEADIVYMNEKSRESFAMYGENLLNQSLYNCHGEASSEKIRQMLADGTENIYTIEKAGVKKIIVQMPWKNNDEVDGLVELSIELPLDMPHFVRK